MSNLTFLLVYFHHFAPCTKCSSMAEFISGLHELSQLEHLSLEYCFTSVTSQILFSPFTVAQFLVVDLEIDNTDLSELCHLLTSCTGGGLFTSMTIVQTSISRILFTGWYTTIRNSLTPNSLTWGDFELSVRWKDWNTDTHTDTMIWILNNILLDHIISMSIDDVGLIERDMWLKNFSQWRNLECLELNDQPLVGILGALGECVPQDEGSEMSIIFPNLHTVVRWYKSFYP